MTIKIWQFTILNNRNTNSAWCAVWYRPVQYIVYYNTFNVHTVHCVMDWLCAGFVVGSWQRFQLFNWCFRLLIIVNVFSLIIRKLHWLLRSLLHKQKRLVVMVMILLMLVADHLPNSEDIIFRGTTDHPGLIRVPSEVRNLCSMTTMNELYKHTQVNPLKHTTISHTFLTL